MRRRRHSLALLLILIGWVAQVARADDRAPVPSSREQNKALQAIREQFKEHYAHKDASGRLTLSQELRKQAAASESDLARQYVLLREARELAVDAGDFDAAFAAIDDMAKIFVVNARELKISALAAALDKAAIQPAALAQQYLKVADHALVDGDVAMAVQTALLAHQTAFKSRDTAAMSKSREMDARVREARQRLNLALAAYKRLQSHPDDADASLTVGKYLCFVEGRWDEGLPRLAHGSDPKLKALAEKDLAAPTDAAAMADVADAWWDQPDSKETPHRRSHQRAGFWYEKALPNLKENRKATAEERIGQITARDVVK